MSDPKWTPEFKARCLAAARAARTEPETAESLRAALATSEAALFDARFLGAADRVALEDAVKRANASEAARVAELEAERADLDERLVNAVHGVPTSVSLERELTKATAIFEPRPAVGMGLGLFAVVNISAGTLLWSPAENERKFAHGDVDSLDAATREALDTYGVDGPDGLLWLYEGPEKYLNHSCDPNVIRMADGTEVASRDIAAGDQLGIDYADYAGPWSKGWSMDCRCGTMNCRGVIRPNEDSALAAASRASKE